MKQEFKMMQEELDNIIAINKSGSDPVMFISGGTSIGSSLQEKVNHYWNILADKYGFKQMSVEGSSKGNLYFLERGLRLLPFGRFTWIREHLRQAAPARVFHEHGFSLRGGLAGIGLDFPQREDGGDVLLELLPERTFAEPVGAGDAVVIVVARRRYSAVSGGRRMYFSRTSSHA